jgi:cytochrome c-type biogenesis protein
MSEDISAALAFGAGLLSFLSPCVLPLIPSYLSLLGGAAPDKPELNAQGGSGKPRLAAVTLSFIFGFSLVFIVLSLLFSTGFALMGGVSKIITIVAGVIVILLGLNVLFDFFKILNYEKRFRPAGRPKGIIGGFLAGVAFGAGWTPCIGPILTGILLLAGQSGKAGMAALYLACYSAGLGLPFLLAALFFDRFLVSAAKLKKHLPAVKKISGILLVIIGILILTGRFTALNIFIQGAQYRYIDWAETKALPFRLLAQWFRWLQSM